MPAPRSAGLIAVVMAMTSLFVVAPAQAKGVRAQAAEAVRAVDPPSLTALRKEAERAALQLEGAAKALEKRQGEIKAAGVELKRKLADLRKAEAELALRRQPVSQIVELLYEQPMSDGVAPFLSGDASQGTLRALSDLNQIVSSRQLLAQAIGRLYADKERLAAEAEELRAEKLLAEAQLSVEMDTLVKRSDKTVKSLTAALVKLGIKIDKVGRAAFSCNPLRVNSTTEYPNGLIPKSLLCPLQQRGHLLRADSAIAFVSLSEAYKKAFGRPICVTDAYRTLAEQQSVYYTRRGFAAVPGRSNHGLGLAVDLCGGVQNSGSPQFRWMETNGKKYGWFHPDWAYSNPFEPWHWEYDPKLGSVL
ncbi:D-alanyl-D-alanine carboxypeptidase family protein [Nonomuraea sp. NPDC046570]|uniref:D-alanyl-D-alanine carboxypeptidase family protein n=1 Tax=Nonomuraea sp. NPDC046570 TaxID=3155255 RepID=UPI0033C1A6FC